MTNEEFAAMLKTEESKRVIMEMIIAELKKNGPIRMALIGLFPNTPSQEKKVDA